MWSFPSMRFFLPKKETKGFFPILFAKYYRHFEIAKTIFVKIHLP